MYDTYIFDLYGTLVDIHTDEENQSLWKEFSKYLSNYQVEYDAKELQITYEELIEEEENRLHQVTLADRRGEEISVEINLLNVFKEIYLKKGYVFVDEETFEALVKETTNFFRSKSREYVRLYDGAEDLLENLKAKGKRVILLSNAQAIFTTGEINKLGIEKYFDKIYLSSDYGVKKPDQTFFEFPYKEFNLDKKKTIMIGNDQTTDIAGAREFGYDTCYLHSNISPELIETVKATFVQNPIDLTSLNKILMI
jgi:putative hydrolase of the HAD superfamily